VSFKAYFRYYLLKSLFLLMGVIAIPTLVLLFSLVTGVITWANQSELEAKACQKTVEIAPDITKVQFPENCEYLILDKHFQIQFGSIENRKEQEAAIQIAKGEQSSYKTGTKIAYLLAVRKDGYCVLKYYIGSQYTNLWMQEHLLPPEKVYFIILAVMVVGAFLLITARFSQKIKKQVQPLMEATQEIARQNLDFSIQHADIWEFENILGSFDQMRESLKKSLKKQWDMEKMQKEQIAALAHDLKTPLTVVEGNLDLLAETNLDEEQKKYISYAVNNAELIRQYMQKLLEVSRAAVGYELQKKSIELKPFWNRIINQAQVLGRTKHIILESKNGEMPRVSVDPILFERAVMNLVSNAVEYTKEDGKIILFAGKKEKELWISVEDSGNGFSAEALQHGKEQFFKADQSRNSKEHYGMGLYIANSIVEQHGGRLILENSKITGGAITVIRIPLCLL